MGELTFNTTEVVPISGQENSMGILESHPISASMIIEGKRITVNTTSELMDQSFRDFALSLGIPDEKISHTLEMTEFKLREWGKEKGFVSFINERFYLNLNIGATYVDTSRTSPEALERALSYTFLHECVHLMQYGNSTSFRRAQKNIVSRERNLAKFEVAFWGTGTSGLLLLAYDLLRDLGEKPNITLAEALVVEVLASIYFMAYKPTYRWTPHEWQARKLVKRGVRRMYQDKAKFTSPFTVTIEDVKEALPSNEN